MLYHRIFRRCLFTFFLKLEGAICYCTIQIPKKDLGSGWRWILNQLIPGDYVSVPVSLARASGTKFGSQSRSNGLTRLTPGGGRCVSHSFKTTATPAKEGGKLKYCTKVGVVLAHKRNEKIYWSRSYRFVGIRLVFLTTNEYRKYRVRFVVLHGG